jgi:hypothetical protein
MTAPTCPTSNSQIDYYQSLFRGSVGGGPRPLPMPSIPTATNDLPSLLRTVNVMRDVLRQLTSSLVVNNVHIPRAPFFKAQGDTYLPDYPAWDLTQKDTVRGWVLGKSDPTSRVWVQRENAVQYENRMADDKPFIWRYVKPLDAEGTEPLFPTAGFP